MSRRRAFLTPDEAPGGTKEVTLTVPDGWEWEALARGALALLLNEANFEQHGSYTPAQTAEAFIDALFTTFSAWDGGT